MAWPWNRGIQSLKYLKMSTTHREGRWRGQRPRARHGGAKRRSAEGVGSENFWNLTVQICSFFPRFQDRDSFYIRCFFIHLLPISVLIISVRNLHCILLLQITHSSKVNCTLDKVNWCTLCVRKHTILGPAGVGVVQGHWNWRSSIDHIGLRLSIGRPL